MPSSKPSSDHVSPFQTILVVSAVLRAALIIYSEWHDARSVVKYTDVDYRVFSDAARFLLHHSTLNHAQGSIGRIISLGNPYERDTYRYTPLLALLLTPNEWLHPSFGKCLFAACDIVNGILIYHILLYLATPKYQTSRATHDRHPSATEESKSSACLLMGLHLFNPLIFTISTRGSSESVLATFVLATMYAAMQENWDLAAVWLGLSVHWKIYPVIYGISCVGVIFRRNGLLKAFRFTLLSAGTFFLLGAACYMVWGAPFIAESYLYHLHRLDHRHNFSPYFYLTYLTYPAMEPPFEAVNSSFWTSLLQSPLITFAPQMILSLGTGLLFGRMKQDLPFAWFVQTTMFVLFNKVCTSQYFLWYLLILPLVLPRLRISVRMAAVYIAVWLGTQAIWLAEAYKLEFLGEDVYLSLWMRSMIYVLGNSWVLAGIMKHYSCSTA